MKVAVDDQDEPSEVGKDSNGEEEVNDDAREDFLVEAGVAHDTLAAAGFGLLFQVVDPVQQKTVCIHALH